MNIIAHRKIWLLIGVVIMVASAAIVATLGLRLGIDFTGGALTEAAFEVRPEKTEIESALTAFDLGGYSLRESIDDAGRPAYILRTRDLSEEERQQVEEAVMNTGSGAEITRYTSIGPVIGQELKDKAVWAIGGVVAIIVIYVAFAFMGVGTPVGSWVYGGITILALAHDVLVPAAVMSLLGYFAGIEVDVLFVMALLAVLGYSVNDTIVVFDRVRENLFKYRTAHKRTINEPGGMKREEITYTLNQPFDELVNTSVNESMLRSINTSLTTLLALCALYYVGGAATTTFALVMIAGVAAGAYSSIFIASPLLVWYEETFVRNKKQS